MGISGVRLNKAHIIHALKQNKGVIAFAAEALKCERRTIYDWIDRDEDVKKALHEARETDIRETADRNLVLREKAYKAAAKLLDKNDCTMTIFTLKTQGGWKEAALEQNITLEHIEKPYRIEAKLTNAIREKDSDSL